MSRVAQGTPAWPIKWDADSADAHAERDVEPREVGRLAMWASFMDATTKMIQEKGPLWVISAISSLLAVVGVVHEVNPAAAVYLGVTVFVLGLVASTILLSIDTKKQRASIRDCETLLARYYSEIGEKANPQEYEILDWVEHEVILDRSGKGDSQMIVTLQTGKRPLKAISQSRKYITDPTYNRYRYQRKTTCSAVELCDNGQDGPPLLVRLAWDQKDRHRLRFYVFFDPELPANSVINFKIDLHIPRMGWDYLNSESNAAKVTYTTRRRVKHFKHILTFMAECDVGDRLTVVPLTPIPAPRRGGQATQTLGTGGQATHTVGTGGQATQTLGIGGQATQTLGTGCPLGTGCQATQTVSEPHPRIDRTGSTPEVSIEYEISEIKRPPGVNTPNIPKSLRGYRLSIRS
jgi:hypothetical protein